MSHDPIDWDAYIHSLEFLNEANDWPMEASSLGIKSLWKPIESLVKKYGCKLMLVKEEDFGLDYPTMESIIKRGDVKKIKEVGSGLQGTVWLVKTLCGVSYRWTKNKTVHTSMACGKHNGKWLPLVLKVSNISRDAIEFAETIKRRRLQGKYFQKASNQIKRLQRKDATDLSNEVYVDVICQQVASSLLRCNLIHPCVPLVFRSMLARRDVGLGADYPEIFSELLWEQKLDGQFDDLVEKGWFGTTKKPHLKRWSSFFLQISLGLQNLQVLISFVHNDLYMHNIMYVKTKNPYLYFKHGDSFLKVPTYGYRFYLMDFGRAHFVLGNRTFVSDALEKNMGYNYDPSRFSTDITALVLQLCEKEEWNWRMMIDRDDFLGFLVKGAAFAVSREENMFERLEECQLGDKTPSESSHETHLENCFYDNVVGEKGGIADRRRRKCKSIYPLQVIEYLSREMSCTKEDTRGKEIYKVLVTRTS